MRHKVRLVSVKNYKHVDDTKRKEEAGGMMGAEIREKDRSWDEMLLSFFIDVMSFY